MSPLISVRHEVYMNLESTSSVIKLWCYHLFISCVTLSKLLNFWEPHFHSLCILCVPHFWKSESLTSPHSISDPHNTQDDDFKKFSL